jgi:hypothetical protein
VEEIEEETDGARNIRLVRRYKVGDDGDERDPLLRSSSPTRRRFGGWEVN